MKKLISIALFLLLVLSLSLTACGETGAMVKLTFMVDGEQYHLTSTEQGKMPTLPSDPVKEGFSFDAWYFDNGVWEKPLTANSFLDLPIKENMTVTVYAHFTDSSSSHNPDDPDPQEPPIQGLTFDEAVSIYKAKTPLYIKFSATISGQTMDDIEWYESPAELIVRVSSTANGPKSIYYYDKATEKAYEVDKINHKKIQSNVAMLNLVPTITGFGTTSTATYNTKTYESKDFEVDTDVFVRFLKENNQLKYILFTNSTESAMRIYSNITIANTIPTTSQLFDVANYPTSDWIACQQKSNAMSPALTMGTVYHFQPVDASTLVVGNIILVNRVVDSQTIQLILRIAEIRNNGGTLSFVLKADANSLADSEIYTADKILGLLVESESGGSIDNPPQGNSTAISSYQDLVNISAAPTASYHLTNDIDCNNATWTPISSFSGVLCGNGYTISNLRIDATRANVGLFENLQGEVDYLVLDNISVSLTNASSNIGIIAANLSGKISKCAINGSITYNSSGTAITYLGGVVGMASSNTGAIIENVYSNINISVYDTNTDSSDGLKMSACGGIVGKTTYKTTIKNCIVAGKIEVRSQAPEVCGVVARAMQNTEITNCVVLAEVYAFSTYEDDFAGAKTIAQKYISGSLANGTSEPKGAMINNCYYLNTQSTRIGDLTGYTTESNANKNATSLTAVNLASNAFMSGTCLFDLEVWDFSSGTPTLR